MKKIILFLFTVSFPLSISADNIKMKNYNNLNALSTCYTQVVVNHETLCGEYVFSTKSPKYEVNCREGQTAGSTTTYYETRYINGWNLGSGPQKATNCLN